MNAVAEIAASHDAFVVIVGGGPVGMGLAVADSFRAGRVFIAGDAAHSHPPNGGYGINSELEDARNLGWKLDAVLQGWGGDALLDSYDAERRPVFGSTVDDFIAKSTEDDRRFLQEHDPARDRVASELPCQARAKEAAGEVHAFEPHYEGSPVVWPGAGAGCVCSAKSSHRFEARAGHHLAPAELAGGKNVHEALGPGLTLLALDAAPAGVRAFRKGAQPHGLPLTVVEAPARNDAQRYAARWVLVRPDHFVAWASEDAQITGDAAIRVLLHAQGGETRDQHAAQVPTHNFMETR